MITANRQKTLYAAAGSAVIGIVLVVFFSFGQWIDGTPGSTSFGSRGVQSAFDSTVTVTQQTSEFRPGTFYYYWVSIDTPAYTVPIAAAAVLLALAGWVALVAARTDAPNPRALRRGLKFALAAVALGVVGGVLFEVILYVLDPIDWWLDAGFYGLVSAGATTAILLWLAARPPAPVTPSEPVE